MRRIRAALLLACFVSGAIFAPASHFVFMAVSSVYMPMSAHATHAPQYTHAPDMEMESGAALKDSSHHEACTYADLYATLLVHFQPDHPTLIDDDRVDTYTVYETDLIIEPTSSTHPVRGPPLS